MRPQHRDAELGRGDTVRQGLIFFRKSENPHL